MKLSYIWAFLTVIAFLALPYTVIQTVKLIPIQEVRMLAINIFLLIWCHAMFKGFNALESEGKKE